MENKLLKLTFLSILSLSVGGALLFGASNKEAAQADAYGTASLPTTINLNDCSESTIRSYYTSVNGLTGTDLLAALKPVLKNGQRYFSYDTDSSGKKLWQMYEIIDRDWEKSPASSTTYGTYDATTNTISNYQYGNSNSDGKNNPYLHALYINRNVENETKAWGNHNQDQWGINREHIWPKSQGFNATGAGGARGDPMHLWAGNGYSNNIHNDHPYGYVDKTKSYTDCGSTYANQTGNLLGKSKTTGSGTVFEPQDCDKGDIARAVFYMVARYNYLSGSDSDGISQDNPNLELVDYAAESSAYTSSTTTTGKMGIVQDLLEWNRIDPPDEFEIHRNNLLYVNYTNNRNPFIDFPQWADYIWGDSTKNAKPATDTLNGFNPPATVSLSETSLTITEGETASLTATASDGEAYQLNFASNNTGVATVSSATVNTGTAVTITGVDAGETTISVTGTVEGNAVNLSCTVTVNEEKTLSSISVSGQTTSFKVNDTFAFGGTVTAHYSDDTTADITSSATFSGYDMSTAGTQTVTVSYTENEVNKTTTYQITVATTQATLTGIKIISYPTKNVYEYNEDLDTTGLIVFAVYSDSHSEKITNYTISGYDKTKSGTQTITITYQGFEATFTVTVKDAPPVEPEVDLEAEKNNAINELNIYYSNIDKSKYDDTGKEQLKQAWQNGKTAINNATTVEEINTALTEAKAALDAVSKAQPKKSMCGGSIASTSIVLSSIALMGVGVIIYKRKKLH